MSATTQQPAHPSNGQTTNATRAIRKQRKSKSAAVKARTKTSASALPRKQQAMAPTTTRRLPASADLPMPTSGKGPPALMTNLVQALPVSGSPFSQEQRAAWLKAAEANLAVAYPLAAAA